MVSIHLRLDKELASQINYLGKSLGFGSVQELIRELIRRSLEEYEKKVLIRKLKALQGSAKLKKNILPKEQWFKEYLKKDPSEILRKFNLKP